MSTLWCVLLLWIAGPVWAQQNVILNVGYGGIWYESEDLDRFVRTFNTVNDSALAVPFESFENSRGWHFDAGYEYVYEDVVSISFITGYHRYTEDRNAEFTNGTGRDLRLSMRDLSETMEIAIYTERGAFGPLVEVVNRKIVLISEHVDEDGTLSRGLSEPLNGKYTGFSWGMNVGGSLSMELVAPLFLTARLTYPILTFGEDTLFDGNLDKVETDSNYFPADYALFLEGTRRPRRNGISENLQGLQFSLSLTIYMPLVE